MKSTDSDSFDSNLTDPPYLVRNTSRDGRRVINGSRLDTLRELDAEMPNDLVLA